MRLSKEELRPLIEDASFKYQVDPNLIWAVVMVESGGDPYAVRFEPGWKYSLHPGTYASRNKISVDTEIHLQKCSWGLMQVMGTVAREMGLMDSLLTLINPKTALDIGTKKLKSLLSKYDTWDAVSSYNQGRPMKDRQAKYYLNQEYVDKVKNFMDEGLYERQSS